MLQTLFLAVPGGTEQHLLLRVFRLLTLVVVVAVLEPDLLVLLPRVGLVVVALVGLIL